MEFDAGKWHARIIFEPGNFHSLVDHVLNSTSLDAHFELGMFVNENGVSQKFTELDTHIQEMIKAGTSDSVNSAVDTLARQMIVLSVTLTEGMIGEFIECIFFRHPERMHQFLEIGGVKGVLSLTQVISSKSVTDLQVELARIGSRKALQGKFSSLFDKIKKISGQDIQNDLKNRLIETTQLRNEIVHEVKYPLVTPENVSSSYDDMYQLLVCLCHATKENNVSLNDPGGLLI